MQTMGRAYNHPQTNPSFDGSGAGEKTDRLLERVATLRMEATTESADRRTRLGIDDSDGAAVNMNIYADSWIPAGRLRQWREGGNRGTSE